LNDKGLSFIMSRLKRRGWLWREKKDALG